MHFHKLNERLFFCQYHVYRILHSDQLWTPLTWTLKARFKLDMHTYIISHYDPYLYWYNLKQKYT